MSSDNLVDRSLNIEINTQNPNPTENAQVNAHDPQMISTNDNQQTQPNEQPQCNTPLQAHQPNELVQAQPNVPSPNEQNNDAEINREEAEAAFEDAEDSDNNNEFEQYFINEIDEDDQDADDFFSDVDEHDDAYDVEVDQDVEEYQDDDDQVEDEDDEDFLDLDTEEEDDDEIYEDEDEDEDWHLQNSLSNHDEYENVPTLQVNYDTELPSTHNYLGNNFQEVVASKHIHESNEQIEIPLLPLPGNSYYENESDTYAQLIPGQVMPIFFYSPLHIQVVRKRMRDQNPTVGFVLSPKSLQNSTTPTTGAAAATITTNNNNNGGSGGNGDTPNNASNDDIEQEDPKLGIIAEIISVSQNDDSQPINDFGSLIESGTGIILKIKGRERFKIIRLRKDITGCFIATARILPEFVFNENPLYRQAQNHTTYNYDAFLHKSTAWPNQKCSLSKAELANTVLNQPAWLYRYYDCSYLVYSIKKELMETFGQQVPLDEMTTASTVATTSTSQNLVNDSNDAQVFSSWLLSNFPFDNKMRINCLKMDCINQRLIYMFDLLKNFTNICCRNCDAQFCTKHDVFSISKQGFMSAYLNPGGVVHETLTVYKLKNFTMTNARPSTQNTWFPGYGWQICYCSRCNSHIGWKFTPTNSNLKPEKFWGLTRTAIKYTYNKEIAEEESSTSHQESTMPETTGGELVSSNLT